MPPHVTRKGKVREKGWAVRPGTNMPDQGATGKAGERGGGWRGTPTLLPFSGLSDCDHVSGSANVWTQAREEAGSHRPGRKSRRDVNEGGRKATESRTTDLLRVPTSCSGPFRQDLLSYIVSPQGYPGSYLEPRFEEFAKNGFQGLESVPGILFPGGPACPAAREPWLGAGPRGEATLLTEDLRKGIPGTTSTLCFVKSPRKGFQGRSTACRLLPRRGCSLARRPRVGRLTPCPET